MYSIISCFNRSEEIRPNAVEGGSAVFRTSINADWKSAGDVISGVTVHVDLVGMVVPAKSSDSTLNSGRIIRLAILDRPDPFYAPFCSIELHFADDRKQVVTSHPASLWG